MREKGGTRRGGSDACRRKGGGPRIFSQAHRGTFALIRRKKTIISRNASLRGKRGGRRRTGEEVLLERRRSETLVM